MTPVIQGPKMRPAILTNTGHYFDFMELDQNDVTITQVALSLSKICRFCGHSKFFYSVAQHSVLVSKLVPEEFALQGLLHDAHEAFTGDISSPLKVLLPEFREIEHRIQESVMKKLGATWPLDASVKKADLAALKTEQRDVIIQTDKRAPEWIINEIADENIIRPMSIDYAYFLFLNRYKTLTGKF